MRGLQRISSRCKSLARPTISGNSQPQAPEKHRDSIDIRPSLNAFDEIALIDDKRASEKTGLIREGP